MASQHGRRRCSSPLSTGEVDLIDAEVKELDEEIHRLIERRRLLWQRRNTLVTINRLPEELLVEILDLSGKSWLSTTPLMKLLWVCQWWRKIALESSRLWTWIGQMNSTELSRWLSLSKHSSLHINFVNSRSFSAKFTQELFAALQRTQTLRLGFLHINLEIKFYWTQPPHRLEVLGLENVELSTRALAKAPLLHLFMGQCKFRWESRVSGCSHLVSFHLIHPVDQVPLTTFLNLVKGMPRLNTLVLVEALQESSSEQPSPISIPILGLSILKIHSKNIELHLQFLELSSCITQQTDALLDFELSTRDRAQIHLALSRLDSLCCTPARKVTQLDLWDSTSVDIRYSCVVHNATDQEKPVRLIIKGHFVNASASSIRTATILSANLFLEHLHTLTISAPDSEARRDDNYHAKLVRLFGTLPHLEQVDLHSRSAMWQLLRASTAICDPDAPMPFPALKRIGQFQNRDKWDDFPKLLLSFLDNRVKHERDISTLIFKKAAVGWDEEMMEELRRITGTIVYRVDSETRWDDPGLKSLSLQNWRTDLYCI
ncbi:hypothetical protein BDN72DRAFT_193558 [Pluteus cervinus]|uniref:Uncharacterized protein n=1 Tax=Pluteus cervinus TaxID=181527 RepID=A0ACD3AIK4_9AGAR|nr:hypothetical protein BDN72DRAFT_193558 [Pluteus cervinus]